jgi:hypothetical protein
LAASGVKPALSADLIAPIENDDYEAASKAIECLSTQQEQENGTAEVDQDREEADKVSDRGLRLEVLTPSIIDRDCTGKQERNESEEEERNTGLDEIEEGNNPNEDGPSVVGWAIHIL